MEWLSAKEKPPEADGFVLIFPAGELLLCAVAVTAAELVHATGGVDQFLLAREEGVGRRGDLELYKGIFLAVDFNGLT